MKEKDIIEFFDSWADVWDERMVVDEKIVANILNLAQVKEGKKILDVACGTGVMIPFYTDRGVKSVTGIDISPRMAQIAKDKFRRDDVQIICGNARDYIYEEKYDCIIIYNAFPHFVDPQRLIDHLCRQLNENGTLTVAHGMSREKVNMHHDNVMNISRLLPDTNEMKKMFEKHLRVMETVSDENMYLVTGVK